MGAARKVELDARSRFQQQLVIVSTFRNRALERNAACAIPVIAWFWSTMDKQAADAYSANTRVSWFPMTRQPLTELDAMGLPASVETAELVDPAVAEPGSTGRHDRDHRFTLFI